MEYSSEQHDIIRRIGELSARIDQTMTAHHAAQGAAARNLAELGNALIAAIDHAAEITSLCRQHGDLWREFLDTL